MITVPFRWDAYDHQNHEDPCSHPISGISMGQGIRENGSRYLGWRLLDELRAIGFVGATARFYWSEHLRHFGDPQSIIVARKPARAAFHG